MRAVLIACLLISTPVWAEPPSTFDQAKRIARDVVYAGHHETIYCGCRFDPTRASGGVIDPTSCGIEPRKDRQRAMRLEWEHATPAAWFGRLRSCWTNGDPGCVDSHGKSFKGRKCCVKMDAWFRHAEADLHNLFPAAGELNGDRKDKPYGEIPGEERRYGACDFEVNADMAEPRKAIRGELARAVLYMDRSYGPFLTDELRQRYQAWSEDDPPDAWELERERRIQVISK